MSHKDKTQTQTHETPRQTQTPVDENSQTDKETNSDNILRQIHTTPHRRDAKTGAETNPGQ